MKTKVFYFFDWCPVSCVHLRGNDLLKKKKLPAAEFSNFVMDGEAVIDSVDYRSRRDGFFIFRVQLNREFEHRDVIDWARNISLILKAEAFNHDHYYHSGENNYQDESLDLVVHNAVLIENLEDEQFCLRLEEETADEYIKSKVSKLRNCLQGEKKRIADALGVILSEDYFLFSVRALYKTGDPSKRRACLVLEHHQSGKRKEFFTRHEMSIGKAEINETVWAIFGVVAALLVIGIMWKVPISFDDDQTLIYISILALAGSSVGFFVWNYLESNRKYLPERLRLESLKGYLSTCAICSATICAISKNANIHMNYDRVGSDTGDPYKWTLDTVEPVINLQAAKYQSTVGQIATGLGVAAICVGLLAIGQNLKVEPSLVKCEVCGDKNASSTSSENRESLKGQ